MNKPVGGFDPESNIKFMGSALLIMLSVSLFNASHGFVRGVGKSIHPYEIAFFTSLFSFAFYLPWIIRTKFSLMQTDKLGMHLIRSFFNAGAVGAWYTALSLTPLADATALALTSPLFVTLGAVLFLGEKARMRRWIAIGAGIFGALLIIRPGFQSFSIGFGFVLLSIMLGGGSRLFAKHLTKWDRPMTIGAWVALLQIPITFLMAIYFWKWPNLMDKSLIATKVLDVLLDNLGHNSSDMATRRKMSFWATYRSVAKNVMNEHRSNSRNKLKMKVLEGKHVVLLLDCMFR